MTQPTTAAAATIRWALEEPTPFRLWKACRECGIPYTAADSVATLSAKVRALLEGQSAPATPTVQAPSPAPAATPTVQAPATGGGIPSDAELAKLGHPALQRLCMEYRVRMPAGHGASTLRRVLSAERSGRCQHVPVATAAPAARTEPATLAQRVAAPAAASDRPTDGKAQHGAKLAAPAPTVAAKVSNPVQGPNGGPECYVRSARDANVLSVASVGNLLDCLLGRCTTVAELEQVVTWFDEGAAARLHALKSEAMPAAPAPEPMPAAPAPAPMPQKAAQTVSAPAPKVAAPAARPTTYTECSKLSAAALKALAAELGVRLDGLKTHGEQAGKVWQALKPVKGKAPKAEPKPAAPALAPQTVSAPAPKVEPNPVIPGLFVPDGKGGYRPALELEVWAAIDRLEKAAA
jgi:hypothetical protein